MTPEQKAKELVDKMYRVEDQGNLLSGFMDEYLAKACALIAVDEILASNPKGSSGESMEWYWQSVKQSIQAL